MKKLNKREIILAVVSGALLLVFLLVQGVVKPMLEEGGNIDQRVEVSELRLLKLQKTLAGKENVDQWYGQLTNAIGATDNAAKEMPGLLSRIQLMAGDHNVRVLQIQPQRVSEQNDVYFLPVQVEMSGKWPDISRFLAYAQASPEYLFINDLNLQKSSDDTGNLYGRVTMSRMRLKSVI